MPYTFFTAVAHWCFCAPHLQELARVAVPKGHSPSLVRASDTSLATALLKGRSPVTSPMNITPLEGGQGMKVRTNTGATASSSVSIESTSTISVATSDKITATASASTS